MPNQYLVLVTLRLASALLGVAHGHAHGGKMIGKSGAWEGEWKMIEHPPRLDGKGILRETTTYTSPTIKLMTGEAHFTLNPLTHMPFPKGDNTILEVDFSIVDGTGSTKTPLSEVYNHHWLIGTQTSFNPLHACENSFFAGAGAEMRGMPTVYPDGYGLRRFNAKGWCGGNLHFIRTDDLATNWTGLNDPKGDHGAAVKNCIECGYAPGRALECRPELDGQFACCFTGSRCPVNHPKDKSTKSYHLTYNVTWTKNLTAVKLLQGGVLDVSGGLIEWNAAPNLNNSEANQVCTDTMCNITNTWVVDKLHSFGDGICPGTMLWSYLHQHVGALNGTMFINGERICSSIPVHGTDPNNSPGNEKGYIVKFKPCISRDILGNQVRLEKGDNVTIEALYDVDSKSTATLPLPGGKHGGIMGLYFFEIECDEGTFDAEYSCFEGQCLSTGMGAKGEYKTRAACEKACGKEVDDSHANTDIVV